MISVVQKSALVKFSAQQMFDLVDDIESYPQFLPWCSGSRILKREGDIVEGQIDIAKAGFHKSFTTRNRLDRGGKIQISLLEARSNHWKASGASCPCVRMPAKFPWIWNSK